MPFARNQELSIYYETRGDPGGKPILLIEGLTAQLIGWHDELVQRLVERGLYVILMDNRDVGLSDKLGGADLKDGGYTLSDMAADAFAVLDALGIDKAGVVGQSMGGMIAQRMAIERPGRVSSLTLIYTAPSTDPHHIVNADLDQAFAEVPPRLPRNEAIAARLEHASLSRSPGFAWDGEWIEQLASMSYDRCYAPEGGVRQYAAIKRMGNNLPALSALRMPVTIIHGDSDELIGVQSAFDMAAAIPGCEFHVYPGMGHELPRALWAELASIIWRTTSRMVSS